MSESIQKMREQRNELAREARNMLDAVSKEDWNKDTHGAKYDELLNKIDVIDASIKRRQDLLDRTAEKEFSDMGGKITDCDMKAKVKAIDNKWFRGGDKALSAEDWAVKNTMSTTTPAEGGYLVQSDVAAELVIAMKQYGGMREVARVITTEKGNPLSFPTANNTTQVGELKAENITATAEDPGFGTVAVNAYKFSSKVIACPIELLQDSQIDIEAYIRGLVAERIGRITNSYFTTGTGTNEPGGIMTKATDSGVTVNTTTGITYDKLLDLQHEVDPVYRAQGGWMFSDATLKLIRQLVDEQERPLFVPSYDRGIAQGAPAELLGSPVYINQDVPAFTGANRFIAYGQLNKYLIRDVMGLELFRFTDSAYAKLGQVGFLAWFRTGGNLLDVTAVKYATATGS